MLIMHHVFPALLEHMMHNASYFVNIPFLWNTLPADVVSLPTADQFRRSLQSYFFT